jgi:hypothetical protein
MLIINNDFRGESCMNNCKRTDCFACIYGKCLALWDTSGQDRCRFYRTDLKMKQINREISLKGKKLNAR